MGLKKNKREPITHRRCRQVITSLQEDLTKEKQAREKDKENFERRIKKLEARLKQDSSNSSRPPSSDFPHRRYPRRQPSGKRRGGQKGHPGQFRAWLPSEAVDEVIDLSATQCDHCHSSFLKILDRFVRHQVTDFPEIQLEVKEYRRYIFRCRSCGRKTVAPLPPGVSRSRWGFRVQAFVAFGVGKLGLSKRGIVALLKHGFGFQTSVTSVVRHEKTISEAIQPAYEQAQAILETESSTHMDETGWKEQNKPGWLWTAKAPHVTVYRIDAHRSREARDELLGHFKGTLISDQLSTYADWELDQWQLCWAHIRRYLKCFSEAQGKAAEIGKQGLAVSDVVFHKWHEVKKKEKSFDTLGPEIARLQEVFQGILTEGLSCTDAGVASVCLHLLKRETALWTFTRIPGIEPTNNAAEQALRPAVLYRKSSYGTQSEAGSRWLERLWTVVTTLEQNKQSILKFLQEAIQARLLRKRAPTLVPTLSLASNSS